MANKTTLVAIGLLLATALSSCSKKPVGPRVGGIVGGVPGGVTPGFPNNDIKGSDTWSSPSVMDRRQNSSFW